MTCQKCSAQAAVYMKQHRLSLCKTHYLEWFQNQTERTIQKYHMFSREDRILAAVSGGKDSLALWDVLWRLGYTVDGLYIDLGIDGGFGYSAQSHQFTEQFAQERGLQLHVVDVKAQYGENIIETTQRAQRGKQRPCSVCGLAKRHIMNEITRKFGYSVVATGHNLDDEAAVLFANSLDWSLDHLRSQKPVLPAADGLARKVKPFCRFYERETAAYTILRKIQYIYEECPYSNFSKSLQYKELLNQLESRQPGVKLRYYAKFLDAKEKGLFASIQPEPTPREPLQTCIRCGQATTNSSKICSFCRLYSNDLSLK